ncbi:MAG: UDP-2,3-diacylglucosamine diphosphatase LpxI [Pseudomonadota bacterium]
MRIGIIAGNGELPLRVAKAYTNLGKEVVIARISSSDPDKYEAYNNIELLVGEVGSIFRYFSANDVSEVIMAGGLTRPKFTDLKVDAKGAGLVARIIKSKFLGDDKLLKVVANFIEENGFKVISATSILQNSTIPRSNITTQSPSSKDMQDIELGMIEAKKIGSKDIGQSVVIDNGEVLGVEGPDGTDALLTICSSLGKYQEKPHPSGVLVKAMKPGQDERFDMPTIGVNTAKHLASCGFAGIAIEANKVIVIDQEEVIETANKLGIFIVAI